MPAQTKFEIKLGAATREAFGRTLVELGRENKDVVVCDADLSKSTMTTYFAKEFPDRFFSFGIAESNMVAAGCGTLLGMGWGAFISADWAFACTLMPKQQAGSYMGIWDVTTLLPQILAPVIAAPIRDSIYNALADQRIAQLGQAAVDLAREHIVAVDPRRRGQDAILGVFARRLAQHLLLIAVEVIHPGSSCGALQSQARIPPWATSFGSRSKK